MNMQMVLKKLISLLLKEIFEVYPTQNLLRYLPQHDQKTPSGIQALAEENKVKKSLLNL